jgi:hypothetical protein
MRQPHIDSKSGDVIGDINYFPASGAPIPKSAWKTQYLSDNNEFTRSMIIRDVRTSYRSFRLDTHGFEFVQLPYKQRVSRDDGEETVMHEYYPELESVVRQLYIHTQSVTSHWLESD